LLPAAAIVLVSAVVPVLLVWIALLVMDKQIARDIAVAVVLKASEGFNCVSQIITSSIAILLSATHLVRIDNIS
jgi:hypothetical protein